MILDVSVDLHYTAPTETDLILQIEVPDLADQEILSEGFSVGQTEHAARIVGEDGLGLRRLLRIDGELKCVYRSRIKVDRPALDVTQLSATPPHMLPSNTIRYLMPSRYCQSHEMQSFVSTEFGHLTGGSRIAAMRDWVFEHYTYDPGSSTAATTAIDTFVQRRGVCRDFAHVMITLARATAIPARFVSVYAPYVTPQDFHAVAEVFLEGTWHLVDATGMAAANQIARIGVGADAAEVPFLTSFGRMNLQDQTVNVLISEGSQE